MKAKLLTGLVLFLLMSAFPALSAELKPYQKDALKKLEEIHGGMWSMVKQQYETVIRQASEQQAQAIVKAVAEERGKTDSDEAETADSGGSDNWEKAEAAREDLEKQIEKPYNAFIEHVSQLFSTRITIAQQANSEIYNAEKGGRLSAVTDTFRHNKFLTNKSIDDGFEELRQARDKLMTSGKYYKVTLPSGNPPDNTGAIRDIVATATAQITALNNQYGKIAADIKKRLDAIPYEGGGNIDKTYNALVAERERHNKTLSAQVVKIVNDLNVKIAEQDRPMFNWMIRPLKEAQPQTGPSAN